MLLSLVAIEQAIDGDLLDLPYHTSAYAVSTDLEPSAMVWRYQTLLPDGYIAAILLIPTDFRIDRPCTNMSTPVNSVHPL